jgi:alkaline phosphatase
MALGLLFSRCHTTASPQLNTPEDPANPPPPAIILLIGDGMGLTQLSAALYSSAAPLNMERMPVVGFIKTQAMPDLVTDSAAAGTALACGVKTYNGAIGLTHDTLPCPSILEIAREGGMATGMVVACALVHATPATFAAHQPLRVFYEDIALDIATANIDLLIGGGKRYFDRRDNDDRDLLAEMQTRGYVVRDYFNGDLHTIKPDTARRFFYLTADNHPLPVSQGRTYLSYATQMGLEFLHVRGKDKGFFLLVEGSQIDWANHANEGKLAIQETLDFDRTVGRALDFAQRRGNTLVIVTADHESGGMAIQPGSKRGKVKTEFTTNGHTAAMVPLLAYGPGSEAFAGIYENTEVFHKMRRFLAQAAEKNNAGFNN